MLFGMALLWIYTNKETFERAENLELNSGGIEGALGE